MTAARSDLMALKPCPFCGSADISHRYVRDGRQVFCQGCSASARPTFHGPAGDTIERAAALWNTRAASQPDREAVARILDPDLFARYDAKAAEGKTAENGRKWADLLYGKKIESVLAKADAILSLLSGAGTKSDGPGMRVRDNPRSHGESLQQGPDTSSTTGTASESPQGEVADAASVAKQVTATDRASLAVPGPSDPSPGPDVRRRVLDILNAVAPAVENLAGHQEQCDMDGVMVKVSRQALDEVLNAVNEVALVSALTRPLGGNIK